MGKVRFDIYGRYQLQVERRDGRWVAYIVGEGKLRVHPSLHIPPEVAEDDLPAYLDDLLHEEGGGGRTIRRLGSGG